MSTHDKREATGKQQQEEQTRRHIRAARDWLSEAESSMEAEKGLRGNLRLMLAEAELRHAQEHNGFSRRLKKSRKTFALLTAALIAALLLFFRMTTPIEKSKPIPTPPPTITEALPAPTPSPAPAEETVPPAMPPTSVAEAQVPASLPTPTPRAERVRPDETPKTHTPVQERPMTRVPKVESVSPAPPPLATQKLMQDAGRILRE